MVLHYQLQAASNLMKLKYILLIAAIGLSFRLADKIESPYRETVVVDTTVVGLCCHEKSFG